MAENPVAEPVPSETPARVRELPEQAVTSTPRSTAVASINASASACNDAYLSGVELIRLFEITLAEIRAAQTLTLSLLGFAVASAAFAQKIHDSAGKHGIVFFGILALGIFFCVCGAALAGILGKHLNPLQDFILAAEPGPRELVLNALRGALHKAIDATRGLRVFKLLSFFGASLAAIAVLCETYCHWR